MAKTINIHEFLQEFNENYSYLYDVGDQVPQFQEAVDAFDEFLKSHREFVMEFNQLRGDLITSDREAAAFMFTLNEAIA